MKNIAYNISFTKYSDNLSIMHIGDAKNFIVSNKKKSFIMNIFNSDDEELKDGLYERLLNFKNTDEKVVSFQDFQYKKVLISSRLMEKVSTFMSFMFNKVVLTIAVAIIISMNVYLYFINQPAFSNKTMIDLSWGIIIFVFIFHEIGHSTACRACGGKASKIGFGVTMMVPAMFADVSYSWHLEKNQRMMVNFAGIYFQNIFASFFLILSIIIDNSSMYYASKAIFISTLYQFFPFYKSDGYWILTDVIEEPRLYRKSQKIFFTVLRHFKMKLDSNTIICFIYYFVIESVILWFIVGMFIHKKEYISTLPAYLLSVLSGVVHWDMSNVKFDFNYIIVALALYFSGKVILSDIRLFCRSKEM